MRGSRCNPGRGSTMKPTKAVAGKEHVTALIGDVELTVYNEKGQQLNRRSVRIGVIQAGIPDAVRSWLLQAARQAEKNAAKEG